MKNALFRLLACLKRQKKATGRGMRDWREGGEVKSRERWLGSDMGEREGIYPGGGKSVLGGDIDTRRGIYPGEGMVALGDDIDTRRGIYLGRGKNLYPFGKCFLCFTLPKFLSKKD